jgi:hypothetical protein
MSQDHEDTWYFTEVIVLYFVCYLYLSDRTFRYVIGILLIEKQPSWSTIQIIIL